MGDRLGYLNQLIRLNRFIFTVDEASLIWKLKDNQQLWNKLNYYVDSGQIQRLKRGVYHIVGFELDKYLLGTKLRQPSYISFDTVLSLSGVIFQHDSRVFLAGSNSLVLNVDGSEFIFRKLKEIVLFNPKGIEQAGYPKASLERAYLDTLYLDPNRYFDNESAVDFDKCLTIVDIYENKRMKQELEKRMAANVE